jgi:ketosteroid isomerase-like protein
MEQIGAAPAAAVAALPPAVRRFFEGLQTGNWEGIEDYFTPDAVYDGSVPAWHYQHEGSSRIAETLPDEWTRTHSWRIVELRVAPTADGVVVDGELRGRHPGSGRHAPQEVGCRLASIFRLEGGRIAELRFYSCGEWGTETLRRIDAEAPKIRRPATS